ncbi:MAG: FMN-binding negative transcriptional regulator [Alphaproteobacteria bacterium]|nr:FMN-binding negative transcriptional regulator [Alphaproteobacteria bacterium]
MFIPKQFRIEEKKEWKKIVETIQFGVLIIFSEQRFISSHLPLLWEENGEQIILKGHISKANELWKHAIPTNPAMVIFQGAHTYIHPGWYDTKKKTGKAVPTWNYQILHLHGHVQQHNEPEWIIDHLEKLVSRNEHNQKEPWKISDAPQDYITGLSKAIVGLEFNVTKVECSLKMNQHHSKENRLGVIDGLKNSLDFRDQEVANIMEQLELGSKP